MPLLGVTASPEMLGIRYDAFREAIDQAVLAAVDEATQEGLIDGLEDGSKWVRLLNRRFHRVSILSAARKGLEEPTEEPSKPTRVLTPEDVVKALSKRPDLLEGVRQLLS